MVLSGFSNSKFAPRIDESSGAVHCGGVRVGGWRCLSMVGRRLGSDRFALLPHQVYKLCEERDAQPAKRRRVDAEQDTAIEKLSKERIPLHKGCALIKGDMSYQARAVIAESYLPGASYTFRSMGRVNPSQTPPKSAARQEGESFLREAWEGSGAGLPSPNAPHSCGRCRAFCRPW